MGSVSCHSSQWSSASLLKWPVCPNGHFVWLVCQPCLTNDILCPTYRVDMGAGKSLLATTIIQQIDHNCKLDGCKEALTLEELDKHEYG